MRPELFQIPEFIPLLGGKPIHSYGFMIMVGFVVAAWLAARRARRDGISVENVLDTAILMMICGVIGSRIGYLLQFPKEFPGNPLALTTDKLNLPAGIVGWLATMAFFAWRNKGRRARGAVTIGRFLSRLFLVLACCVAVGFLAARAVYLLQHPEQFTLQFVKIWKGGITFYGGLILATLAGVWFMRRRKVPILVMCDLYAPVVMLGLVFGRIGCFLNGCCYGSRVDPAFPLAVVFPPGSPAAPDPSIGLEGLLETATHSKAVHPTEIYSALAALLLFLIVTWLWRRKPRPGATLAWMGVLYSIARFGLEFLRGDNPARHWWGVTFSQMVGVGVLVLAILFLWYLYSRPPLPRPEPQPEQPSGNAQVSASRGG